MWYLCTKLTEIWDFWIFTSQLELALKRSDETRTRFVILLHWAHGDIRFLKFFSHAVLISRKTVKWTKNTICDTCAVNLRRYKIFEFLLHTVIISGKTVKWAKNTICDTCALISRRYEIFEVLALTVVRSRKSAMGAEKTICDTCALNSRSYEIS